MGNKKSTNTGGKLWEKDLAEQLRSKEAAVNLVRNEGEQRLINMIKSYHVLGTLYVCLV